MERESDLCIVCNEKAKLGITLYTKFICVECETEMIRTDVKDEKYKFFINQLRQIRYKKEA